MNNHQKKVERISAELRAYQYDVENYFKVLENDETRADMRCDAKALISALNHVEEKAIELQWALTDEELIFEKMVELHNIVENSQQQKIQVAQILLAAGVKELTYGNKISQEFAEERLKDSLAEMRMYNQVNQVEGERALKMGLAGW